MISIFLLAALTQTQLPAGAVSPLAPDTPKLQQAENLLEKGDFQKARDLLVTITVADPKDARAAYDLGIAEESLDHAAAAKSAYAAAIAADFKQFEAHYALGMVFAREGNMPAAREQFSAATTLAPAGGDTALRARAWRALAHIDAATRPSDARNELLEALKLSPETPDDRQLAASLAAAAGDTTDAEQTYRRTLATQPGDTEASIGLARILDGKKKPAEALAILKTALAAHPNDPALTAQLASHLAAAEDPAGAIAALDASIAAHPEDTAMRRMSARLAMQSGDAAKAVALYEPLAAANPNDTLLLDDYGSALIRANRPADAERVLAKALNNPSSITDKQQLAATASHLAFAANANKDAETTLRALALRDSVEPPSASSLFLAATAHDRLHHTKLAIELYRQFLKEAAGHYPNEEWEARHRLPALERSK